MLRQRKCFAQCSRQFSFSYPSIEKMLANNAMCCTLRTISEIDFFTHSFERQIQSKLFEFSTASCGFYSKCCSHKIYQKYLSLFIWFMERKRQPKLFGNRLAHTQIRRENSGAVAFVWPIKSRILYSSIIEIVFGISFHQKRKIPFVPQCAARKCCFANIRK